MSRAVSGVALHGQHAADVGRLETPRRGARPEQPRQAGVARAHQASTSARAPSRAAARTASARRRRCPPRTRRPITCPLRRRRAPRARRASSRSISASPTVRSAGTHRAGARTATRTGSSAPSPAPSTRSRRSASETIPGPGQITRAAVESAAVSAAAASRTDASARTVTGGRCASSPTRVASAAGARPRSARCASCGRAGSARRTASPAGGRAPQRDLAGTSRQADRSRARTVKLGASPESSDGWPKQVPGSSTSTTSAVHQLHRAGPTTNR